MHVLEGPLKTRLKVEHSHHWMMDNKKVFIHTWTVKSVLDSVGGKRRAHFWTSFSFLCQSDDAAVLVLFSQFSNKRILKTSPLLESLYPFANLGLCRHASPSVLLTPSQQQRMTWFNLACQRSVLWWETKNLVHRDGGTGSRQTDGNTDCRCASHLFCLPSSVRPRGCILSDCSHGIPTPRERVSLPDWSSPPPAGPGHVLDPRWCGCGSLRMTVVYSCVPHTSCLPVLSVHSLDRRGERRSVDRVTGFRRRRSMCLSSAAARRWIGESKTWLCLRLPDFLLTFSVVRCFSLCSVFFF